MTKSQFNFTWIKENFQPKQFQSLIFTGFDYNDLDPMTIIIDKFIDSIDLSFFDKHYKSNDKTGGRPNLNYKIMLKIYMYSLYFNISIRKIKDFNKLGSDLQYLSTGINCFPKKSAFSVFLNVLDNYADVIFKLHIQYLLEHLSLDLLNLYCDGTIFEAHNNRHKIITDTNINRSNKKWQAILDDVNSAEELKKIATEKLALNIERANKLTELKRYSYGRTDEDCVILKDKNGSFIAGYNVQFVEEANYGLIAFPYISNKNPDCIAFEDMVLLLIERYHPKSITLDTGYGTPEILKILHNNKVIAIVKALKNENATKKITDYSFELSENEDCLFCPQGQILEKSKTNDKGEVSFKAVNCTDCELKKDCCPDIKIKTVKINIQEFKLFKQAKRIVDSEYGKEAYSHRGNKCESPNGFIKYNLNGKKLKMDGLKRNQTIIVLYSILFNLRRLISIKSNTNS